MMLNRFISIFLLGALAFSTGPAFPARASAVGKVSGATTPAGEMLARMSPEERVGQLFLVDFAGTKTDNKSQIYDLIVNHFIGGAVLQASNDNFVAAPATAFAAYQMISQLQKTAYDPTQGTPVPTPSIPRVSTNYIPLFVGLSQDGDGSPNDQILSGMTALPDPMAIGATWNTDLAQQVGAVAGMELSSLRRTSSVAIPFGWGPWVRLTLTVCTREATTGWRSSPNISPVRVAPIVRRGRSRLRWSNPSSSSSRSSWRLSLP